MKGYIIHDLQFGSTGKGLLAGYLAKTKKPDTILTNWMTNAGHTFIDEHGHRFVHRSLANGVVSPNIKAVLIGAGSVVNPDLLWKGINECEEALLRQSVDSCLLYTSPSPRDS